MSLATHRPGVSPAILAMIDKAVSDHKRRVASAQVRGWRSMSHRRVALRSLGFLFAEQIDDTTLTGRRAVLNRLRNACNKLRDYAQPSHDLHWTYNPAYHERLLSAYRAERAALDARAYLRAAA